MSYTPPTHEELIREYLERMMCALERIAESSEIISDTLEFHLKMHIEDAKKDEK